MSRNRIIYQNEAIYAGPSIKTGITTGVLKGFHILKKIDNVIAANYGINVSRQDIMQLGSQGIVSRPIFSSPILDLQFSYNFDGFGNETKLGFTTNFTTGNNNAPRFSDNFSVALLSGFVSIDRGRDKRDFYIALADEGEDVYAGDVDSPKGNDLTTLTGIISKNSPTFDILNFQNCYLTKYGMTLKVSEFVTCNLSYLCENMMVFSSGSGVNVFTIDRQTRSPVKTGINLVIPKYSRNNESVLLSNASTLSITANTSADDPISSGLGFSFTDAKFNSFQFEIGLERYPLNSISSKMPVDQVVKFPVIATFSAAGIQGDAFSGDFLSFFNKDKNIDLSLSMKRTLANNPKGDLNSLISIKKATLNSVFFDSAIGSNKSFTIQGQVDLDDADLSKGIFFSGALPTGVIEEFLLKSGILDI
jgi:hypothetical protein